jgi:hypothetical protein
MDRCPICQVAVKPENLLRHLNDIHPRHPETSKLVEQAKAQPGRVAPKSSGRPFRVSRLHVAIVLAVVVLGVGAYYAVAFLNPGAGKPLPCVSGEGRAYHWHVTLSIDAGDPPAPVSIPGNIGISPGCMQILHTHGAGGEIHIEPDTQAQARDYTLREFFLVWGKPFGNPILMHVNGNAVTPPNPETPLRDGASIHLQYTAFVP